MSKIIEIGRSFARPLGFGLLKGTGSNRIGITSHFKYSGVLSIRAKTGWGARLVRSGQINMRPMAERGRTDPAGNLPSDVARAATLLQEAIAILDAGEFDRAAAYADMAREALTEVARAAPR